MSLKSFREKLVRSLDKANNVVGKPKVLRLLVAVSGGKDSVVLLHSLFELSKQLDLELSVAHVNHRLRDASDSDAEFVRTLSESYGLKFYLHQADQRPKSENIEAWARQIRYSFFNEIIAEENITFLATAHHQNDQAETLLWRILSGRIASSGYGIAELDLERKVFRPFLSVEKSEIEEYFVAKELSCVEDETNLDLSYTRNRIRKEIIPYIQEHLNPGLVRTLCDVGERLSDDENLLWTLARAELAKNPHCRELYKIPDALRWRVLVSEARQQLGDDCSSLGYLGFKRLSKALAVDVKSELKIEIHGGVIAEITRGGIKFSKL